MKGESSVMKQKDNIKVSLDLTRPNKEAVDLLAANSSLKFGPTVNKIISTFCRMNGSLKSVLEKACLQEHERLLDLLNITDGGYHCEQIKEQINMFEDFLKLINDGEFKFSNSETKMQKVRLKDGYLIVPKDWVIVNPELANVSRYAAVLECRTSSKYGVPHFIYLNNYKDSLEYTDDMEKDFINLCIRSWPKFKEIEELNRNFKPVFDPENLNQMLNIEAFNNTPTYGIFPILEDGERLGTAPYGATIIRDGSNDDYE